MKTQNANNKLKFDRNSVSELNTVQMNTIYAGTNVHDHDGDGGSGCICDPITDKITKVFQ